MALHPTQEGQIPFEIHSVKTQCSTFYKVFGDLACGNPPVVVLHGGPGAGHEYCLPFANLWPRYGLPVILYDQIGCGASTHLQSKDGDASFWQENLFITELTNVLAFFNLQNEDGIGFHLLGQSWGGCLASAFAASRPKGLQRLVLAGAIASFDLSMQSIDNLRQGLSADVRDVLADSEHRKDFESTAYTNAVLTFFEKHLCRVNPFPRDLLTSLNNMTDDKTVYGTMYGPSTLTPIGSLAGWTVIPRLPSIGAATLVFNGEHDTSGDICTAPFFEHIPHVRWLTFRNASHMCHMDEGGLREYVLKVVGDFLIEDNSISPT